MGWFGWGRRRSAGRIRELEAASAALIAGRVRAVGVPYTLPRDMEEVNRLDFQHYVLRYAFQGLYAVPLRNPRDILDVGTGTGRWAREMAQLFPRAKVVGLDITPPQSDEVASTGVGFDLRPPNYSFVAGNLLEGLPFPDASFDFVHMRLLTFAIPADRWPFVIGELARVTRPGGWVESVEASPPRDGGPAMDLLASWTVAPLARRGVDAIFAPKTGDLLVGAGLAQVSAREIPLPMGAYGGRIGSMLALDYFSIIRSFEGLLVDRGLTTAEEFAQTLALAQADIDSPSYHCIFPFYIAFGQRPARTQ
jgi:ubiquinone/menaquinone biosynthesis C-methylase UbiE